MNINDIIKKFDELPRATYPPYPVDGRNLNPVVIDGDTWAGEPVVKVRDLTHLLGQLVSHLAKEYR